MKERFSLFGRREAAPPREEVRFVPVEEIKSNPYQPRQAFAEDQLADLAASIKEYGVLQPLVVRRDEDGTYELIAGERRLRAARQIGLERVPVVVRDALDRDSAMIALVENLQRADLGYLEEAGGYARLLEEFGLTQEELAQRLGKKQSTIANKLRLLKLSPRVQQELAAAGATERHARALLSLSDEAAQLAVLEEVEKGDLTVRQTEGLIAAMAGSSSEAAAASSALSEAADTAEAPAGKRVHQRRVIRVYRDLRIFVNTFRDAVKVLRTSGVEATMDENDGDEYFEVRVRVKKPAR